MQDVQTFFLSKMYGKITTKELATLRYWFSCVHPVLYVSNLTITAVVSFTEPSACF